MDGDVEGYCYNIFAILAKAFHSTGEIPLWIPNIWGGVSGFHSLSTMFSPVSWILSLLYYIPETGTVSFAVLEGANIFHTALLCIGSYIFCRVSGCKPIVSFYAGSVGAISGSFLSYCHGVNLYDNMAWAPLLLALLLLSWKTDRKTINCYVFLSGIVFFLLLVYNFSQSAVMILLLWFFLFLLYILSIRHDTSAIIEVIKRCVVAGVIGVGLSAIFTFPTLVQSAVNYRYVPDVGFLKPGEMYSFADFTKYLLPASSLGLVCKIKVAQNG